MGYLGTVARRKGGDPESPGYFPFYSFNCSQGGHQFMFNLVNILPGNKAPVNGDDAFYGDDVNFESSVNHIDVKAGHHKRQSRVRASRYSGLPGYNLFFELKQGGHDF